MSEKQFSEFSYPSSRQFTFDVGKIGLSKHHVKALLEVDVSEARKIIKQNRILGLRIPFFTWLIKVIADCVALHPQVAGINQPKRNRIVVFNEVDLSIVVEKWVDGVRVPLPYVIRKADQKSLEQIYSEIETMKSQPITGEGDYVLGEQYSTRGMRAFVRLPQWLRVFVMGAFVMNHPQRMKNLMGTVMVTTVGMAGRTQGWILPFSIHPLCLALGSLDEKPCIYRGQIQKREILHLAVLIDHDVVDGVPAARFVDDLVRKIQTGYGLIQDHEKEMV